jgi:methylenetetrahydrofolate reductase (NADH)
MDSARCVAASRLLGFSRRIGLGEFARFLRRHGNWLGRLMRPHAYRPERLLKRLAPHLAPARQPDRLHVYTFNDNERAERWRHEIARLAGHDL